MASTTDMQRTPRAAVALLGALAFAAGGSRCAQGPGRAEQPVPPLLNASGTVEARAFEALVTRIEDRRGLRYVRRPVLRLVPPGDERLAEHRVDGAAGCAPDPEQAAILCSSPPDADALALALARLIDAQHYPELALPAAGVPGDAGRAIRALLDASARATATTGLGPPLAEPPPGVLEQEQLEVEENEDTTSFLPLVALAFLRGQQDREAPFRDPPLSTRQILSPRDYRDGVHPVLLSGEPPAVPGCDLAGDESVGPAALLTAVARSGGVVPGAALAAWRGDRRVDLTCADGRRPWVYVAEFDDGMAAAAFAGHLESFLAGPSRTLLAGRRVVAWHQIPRDCALAWADALRPAELRRLEALR